jgi:hypothetical protein
MKERNHTMGQQKKPTQIEKNHTMVNRKTIQWSTEKNTKERNHTMVNR